MAVTKDRDHKIPGGVDLAKRAMIRPMSLEDIDKVLKIEKNSFPTPWTRSIFTRELNLDFSYNFVFDLNGDVKGYVSFWVVDDEVHILSIAVEEEYRRRRIGTAILQFTLDVAGEIGGRYAFLEVRESNKEAFRLYSSLRFKTVKIVEGYYTDTREDAIIMARRV
jgi:ribosomal-protein-alanine N-acetyltransferase